MTLAMLVLFGLPVLVVLGLAFRDAWESDELESRVEIDPAVEKLRQSEAAMQDSRDLLRSKLAASRRQLRNLDAQKTIRPRGAA